MATRDPYKVLGVGKSASDAEIKSAYRKLAKRYHPDTNKDDPKAKERFAEANTAYEILSDADKRGQFNRGEIDADGNPRHPGFDPRAGGMGPGGMGRGGRSFNWRISQGAPGGDHSDMFADILGAFASGNGRRGFSGDPFAGAAQPQTPAQKADVSVKLEDIARGNKVRVTLPGGRTLDVNLPDGTRTGTEVRLKGQGQQNPLTGQHSDLILTVRIAPHNAFRIEGDDLRIEQPVPLADAVLGGKVRIRTLSGQADISVPKGTNSGRTMRLKGKGLPKRGGGHGDLLVTLHLQLPDPPDPELEALMKKTRADAAGPA